MVKPRKMYHHRSRYRRLRDEWIERVGSQGPGRVVDLGGVHSAEYHMALGVNGRVEVWNINSSEGAHRVVDLDDPQALPPLPSDSSLVLCFDVLTHLYRPRDLLRHVAFAMPPGAKLLVTVPHHYPLHYCPKDFYRLMPDFFEAVFSELRSEGIRGRLEIQSFGNDLRNVTSFFTPFLFKGGRIGCFLANLFEAGAFWISPIVFLFARRERMQAYAPGSGISWVKD